MHFFAIPSPSFPPRPPPPHLRAAAITAAAVTPGAEYSKRAPAAHPPPQKSGQGKKTVRLLFLGSEFSQRICQKSRFLSSFSVAHSYPFSASLCREMAGLRFFPNTGYIYFFLLARPRRGFFPLSPTSEKQARRRGICQGSFKTIAFRETFPLSLAGIGEKDAPKEKQARSPSLQFGGGTDPLLYGANSRKSFFLSPVGKLWRRNSRQVRGSSYCTSSLPLWALSLKPAAEPLGRCLPTE